MIPGRVPLAFARDRLSFLQRATATYGDAVFFTAAGAPFAILNHPDMVRDVLVTRSHMFHKGVGLERARMLLGDGLLTSEDDRHARQRRLITPAFHRERIAAYAETMVTYAERRSARWRHGQVIDLSREMAAITLAIAGKTLFDADIEGRAAHIGAALTAALDTFIIALLPYGDRLVRLPIPPARRFREARAALDALIYSLIAERRDRAGSGRDLLSMLIAARDTEGDGSGMSDEQVRDEALTLLLAGHETTANALTWTWHLLAQHPGALQALQSEIDGALGGRAPTLADLPRLGYTRAVLAEAMRLYPPAYLVGRRALAPYAVFGTGYVLPARTVVLVSQYLLHRDPRFWDAAGEFRPERWLTAATAGPARHRYAYFPFGGGPRICIGEQFAWTEGILVLATVARGWHFHPAARRPVRPQGIVTLRPRGGLHMTARRR